MLQTHNYWFLGSSGSVSVLAEIVDIVHHHLSIQVEPNGLCSYASPFGFSIGQLQSFEVIVMCLHGQEPDGDK